MRKMILASALGASLVPAHAFAEIQFQEGFEAGANPFSFSGYNDYMEGSSSHFSGERVFVGGVIGHAWKTTFYDSQNDTYFGHRVRQPAGWNIGNRIHWAGYVKFGDEPGQAEWETVDGYTSMGRRSYELKFPDIYPDYAPGRIIGKMRSMGSGGREGMFILYTPNGQNHSPQNEGFAPLESGRWYSIEFMVEDNGNNDVVKVWINSNDEANPTYEHRGGDMIDSSRWGEGMRWDHGYRNHNVGRPTNFYYDQITIANSFIGLTPPEGAANTAPAAPSSLQVAD